MKWEQAMVFIGRSKVAYALTEPLYPRFGSAAKAHVWKAQSSANNQVVNCEILQAGHSPIPIELSERDLARSQV